jgi:hypothetical protein
VGIPDEFRAESLYEPEQWYVDDLLEVDAEHVVGVCDTAALASSHIVAAQRPWPGQPKHVPGIVIVQITGTLGNIHAVLGLGLRMSEGWVGFGTNILEARFRGLGRLGPPLRCELRVDDLRRLEGSMFVTYSFRFSQADATVYTSRQRAAWRRAGE